MPFCVCHPSRTAAALISSVCTSATEHPEVVGETRSDSADERKKHPRKRAINYALNAWKAANRRQRKNCSSL
uniref:Secreted protein n=1 Tax=Panagrellus redivivus TaxID=6233 RepID=A0A7E4WAD1_PANRE